VFFFDALLHKRGKSAGRGPQGEFGKKRSLQRVLFGVKAKGDDETKGSLFCFFFFAEKKQGFC
jgi:hypothetical protein